MAEYSYALIRIAWPTPILHTPWTYLILTRFLKKCLTVPIRCIRMYLNLNQNLNLLILAINVNQIPNNLRLSLTICVNPAYSALINPNPILNVNWEMKLIPRLTTILNHIFSLIKIIPSITWVMMTIKILCHTRCLIVTCENSVYECHPVPTPLNVRRIFTFLNMRITQKLLFENLHLVR